MNSKITKYLVEYNKLNTSEDLQRNGLTLSDYHTIGTVIATRRAKVVSLGVMKWFKKLGAHTEDINGQFLIQL